MQKETSLTGDQLGFLPDYAATAQVFDLSLFLERQIFSLGAVADFVRFQMALTAVIVSDNAVFLNWILGPSNSGTPPRSYYFTVPDIGYLYASHRRAALDALVCLTQPFGRQRQQPSSRQDYTSNDNDPPPSYDYTITNDYDSMHYSEEDEEDNQNDVGGDDEDDGCFLDGGLTGTDLTTLFCSCYPGTVHVHGFAFNERQWMALTECQQPINIELTQAVCAFPGNLDVATFVERLVLEKAQHGRIVGKLTLSFNEEERDLEPPQLSPAVANVLQYHDALLLEELKVPVEMLASNMEVAQILFSSCRRSIRRLVLYGHCSNDTCLVLAEHLAAAMTAGICPRRLQIRAAQLQQHGPLWQSLLSPQCNIEEINLPPGQQALSSLATALRQNRSLRRLSLATATDLLVDAAKDVRQAILAHPFLHTIVVDFLRRGKYRSAQASQLAAFLQQKRQLRLVLRHYETCHKSYQGVVQHALAFNRFHCGVADDLPNEGGRRRLCLFKVALMRRCWRRWRHPRRHDCDHTRDWRFFSSIGKRFDVLFRLSTTTTKEPSNNLNTIQVGLRPLHTLLVPENNANREFHQKGLTKPREH